MPVVANIPHKRLNFQLVIEWSCWQHPIIPNFAYYEYGSQITGIT